MYYNGLFDINDDGKMDGFEDFLEYEAFRDFEKSLMPDDFDQDQGEELDYLEDEEDEAVFGDGWEEDDDLEGWPEDDDYEEDEFNHDGDESGFAALGKLIDELSKLGLEVEASLEFGDDEEDQEENKWEETKEENAVEYKPSPEWKHRSGAAKEDVLLTSFDMLKEDVFQNRDALTGILVQIQGSNPELTIELWEYLIDQHWDEVVYGVHEYGSVCGVLTTDMMLSLCENENFPAFEKHLLASPRIMEAVFQYGPFLVWSMNMWCSLVKRKHFWDADRIFRLVMQNKKNNFDREADCGCSWSEIFEKCVDDYLLTTMTYFGEGWCMGRECKDPDIYEYLSHCAEEITDPKERARINVSLMKIL